MDPAAWDLQCGDSPLVAAAIHNGHAVRAELLEQFAVDDLARLREEDPHTGVWTSVAPTRIVGLRSRFEVDLNRPREAAVYLNPDDAWGMKVWKTRPTAQVIERSLALYDRFYRDVGSVLDELTGRFGRVVVFDLHSYNFRRLGPDAPLADPRHNPEVNVGTRTMDRQRWAPIVDRFMEALRDFDYLGRRLDVRENAKFLGGHFAGWIHETYPKSACAISVEFKKFFMDEWSGAAHPTQMDAIGRVLRWAADCVLEELQKL